MECVQDVLIKQKNYNLKTKKNLLCVIAIVCYTLK